MSEYNTFRCDHCSGPKFKGRGKRPRPVYKRINDEKLYILVKEKILLLRNEWIKKKDTDQYAKCYVCAENIAKELQVKTHRIKIIFQKLNQEGILSLSHNRPPHDCRRATSLMDYGYDNSWQATCYYFRIKDD